MKSQGLPLNFIVLAALAILILVLAAAFILMGGKSIQRTMSPQAARANCKNICYNMQKSASSLEYNSSKKMSVLHSYNATWCAPQDIQGEGSGLTCPSLGESCYVTFVNDVQKEVTCPINQT